MKKNKIKLEFVNNNLVLNANNYRKLSYLAIKQKSTKELPHYNSIKTKTLYSVVSKLYNIQNTVEAVEHHVYHMFKQNELQYSSRRVKTAPKRNKFTEFYNSWEWRRLRMKAIHKYGYKCQCCKSTPNDLQLDGKPTRIVVDHIKPIRKFWELRLEIKNLQILCDECNMGKGSWDFTDWRSPKESHDTNH